MDEFPKDFNRNNIMLTMQKNQLKKDQLEKEFQTQLLRTLRQNFYDNVQYSVDNLQKIAPLQLPIELTVESKSQLIQEILQKFTEIGVQYDGGEIFRYSDKVHLNNAVTIYVHLQ